MSLSREKGSIRNLSALLLAAGSISNESTATKRPKSVCLLKRVVTRECPEHVRSDRRFVQCWANIAYFVRATSTCLRFQVDGESGVSFISIDQRSYDVACSESAATHTALFGGELLLLLYCMHMGINNKITIARPRRCVHGQEQCQLSVLCVVGDDRLRGVSGVTRGTYAGISGKTTPGSQAHRTLSGAHFLT